MKPTVFQVFTLRWVWYILLCLVFSSGVVAVMLGNPKVRMMYFLLYLLQSFCRDCRSPLFLQEK